MLYDALVIGAGAMGSAAVHHLAARGSRVIAVDAFDPPHTLGSTHGRTRIIREAYYEHPSYVPLVRRAYENWDALERDGNVSLFTRTGALMMGAPDSELIQGTLASVAQHSIPVDQLDASAIRSRYPSFSPERGMIGILERNAGILDPERCVATHLRRAVAQGAELRTNTRVSSLAAHGDGVIAVTTNGDIRARRVVICAGPWVQQLLSTFNVKISLEIERQTMHWFDRGGPGPGDIPVVMIEHDDGRLFYAIPNVGDGVKAAIHHDGAIVSTETVVRAVGDSDTAPVLALAERFMAAIGPSIRESAVCLYTDTPTRDFVIDWIPSFPWALIVSACSGHGFKFASAIGEAVADMVLGDSPSVDLSRFQLSS